MCDPLETSAGMRSFYHRLVATAKEALPLLWPSRAKERAIRRAAQWIDQELLPAPHRTRDLDALRRYHERHTDTSLVSAVITAALDQTT